MAMGWCHRVGEVVTGAGDAFNGALATALAEGQALFRRFILAVTSAIAVTRPGAASSMPARESEAFLASQKDAPG